MMRRWVIALIVIVAVVVIWKARRAAVAAAIIISGGNSAPSHIVVDTLNLTNALHCEVNPKTIKQTIVCAAPVLRKLYPDRVVFVVKDRESLANTEETRASYAKTARDASVSVHIVERYEYPGVGGGRAAPLPPLGGHATKARDDFYMAYLAQKLRCPIMTRDKLRDFASFRGSVPPFHVYVYDFWRDLPEREFINPTTLKVRKPRIVAPVSLV
jgi:hypothetical protein